MEEIWKDIEGYEGIYRISNKGRIARFLKPWKTSQKGKYLGVTLAKNKEKRKFLVHRLVAQAFFGQVPEDLVVCHNDDNGHNNVVENLRYDTQVENHKDRKRNYIMRRGENHQSSKLKNKDIFEIRRLIKSGVSQREIAIKYNVTFSLISAINVGRVWAWL